MPVWPGAHWSHSGGRKKPPLPVRPAPGGLGVRAAATSALGAGAPGVRREEEGPSPLAALCSGLCTPANGLSCRARSFSLAPCPARVQRPEHGAAEASPCLPRCSPPPGRPLARGRFPAPPQGLSPPLAPRGQHGGAEGRWKCRPSSKRARGPGSPLWKPVASQHTRSEAGPQIHVLAPSPAVSGSEWLTGRRLWGTLSGALPESGTALGPREKG